MTGVINRAITGFHQDAAGDWVAELACGHNQHVRHAPPWTNRPWVTDPLERDAMIGHALACRKCADGAPADRNHR